MKVTARCLLSAALCLSSVLVSLNASAWGGRGHHSICEAATFLVEDKDLRRFLTLKPQVFGHLCNIPDIYWRGIGSEARNQGLSTHFFDSEMLGLKVEDIPTDYKRIVSQFTGVKNKFKDGTIFSVPGEVGSSWWRADQFYRRAIASQGLLRQSTLPSNSKEEQDEALPFNKGIFDFFVNLGIMGHFVGDNAQPFHSSADYDGYGAGHGGIHAYYEEAVVGALPYDLLSKIVVEGGRLHALVRSKNKDDLKAVRFLTEKTVVEKMRALSAISLQEITQIYKLDPLTKASEQKEEKGMSLRTAAVRESAEVGAAKLEVLIVTEMARASTLLAQVWDLAYAEVGRPQLTKYKSFRYPMTPDFVPPDYFDLKLLEKKSTQ